MSRATRIMIVLLFAAGQGVRTTITACCKRQRNWGNAGEDPSTRRHLGNPF
jgi:hypothetical protein